MSIEKTTTSTSGKTTPRGTMPPCKCKQLKTSNVASNATLSAGFRGNPRWVKAQIEGIKTLRMMTLGAPYRKLPRNVVDSIKWFSDPFRIDGNRRVDSTKLVGEGVE
jgi:hypothetical protein